MKERRIKKGSREELIKGRNIKFYQHQEDTLKAIEEAVKNKEQLVIFNTSPTGAGKTLSAYSAYLKYGYKTIGVYSTNELIKDQYRALSGFDDSKVELVFSDKIDEFMLENDIDNRLKAIEILFSRDVVLTNPDILYCLTFTDFYKGITENYSLAHLLGRYMIWVFDEFHLYDEKQKAEITSIIYESYKLREKISKPVIFIILTATPQEKMLDSIRNIGIKVVNVHAEDGDEIIQEKVKLKLYPSNLWLWKGNEDIEEYLEKNIDNYMKENKSILIIMDSVFQANILSEKLKSKGLDIAEVHGIKKDNEPLKSKITIGTAAIEVGVDPNDADGTYKDVLIAEARSSAQFIQRIGRIARGKRLDRISEAIMFIPQYVFDRLKKYDGNEVNRKELFEQLEKIYYQLEDFEEASRVVAPLTIYNAFSKVSRILGCSLKELEDDFYKITYKNIFKVKKELDEINNLIDKFKHKYEDTFSQVLFSFRDFVPTCYIVDKKRNDYVNVDIITALSRFTDLEVIKEEEEINKYLDKEKANGLRKKIRKDRSSIAVLVGKQSEKKQGGFYFALYEEDDDLDFDELTYNGLKFAVLEVRYKSDINKNALNHINDKLENIIYPVVIQDGIQMNLPPLFKTFDFQDNKKIFIGRNALLMWSILQKRRGIY
ncbi:COG1205: Distinct helicase family with a unique C-terminal domain including a metal-binding cysteine cluster [Thermobrachium celere DSM 8682]|uniref:COG1205: Distinct helicase family with a unique C-terminal domain including a metal-binding cysteine cluster n=1 Tax=Thermobrachium celere DSM 8682 TaxID=941824 RepID=R7RSQ1_9CLOT|nr:COG1205: Distinct helicase family with a unique C-terminal domain including a metal-binding cysteine cluster [Thermobrachium celere DSM 8682]